MEKCLDTDGYPVIAFEAVPEKWRVGNKICREKIIYQDVTEDPDAISCCVIIIHLCSISRFAACSFSERKGALRGVYA